VIQIQNKWLTKVFCINITDNLLYKYNILYIKT